MTKTYQSILKQIDSLKAEAELLRRQEVDGVVERIREAIAHYGLSAADLGLSGARSKAPPVAAKKRRNGAVKAGKPAGAKGQRAVKYRNDAGGSWGGIGKRPQWLRDAIAAGKSLQDFAVQ